LRKELETFRKSKRIEIVEIVERENQNPTPPSCKRVKDIMGSSEISKLSEAK
jgi:hypothetical protein